DRDLHLHLMAGAADQVLVQAHGLGDRGPVLDHRGVDVVLGDLDLPLAQVQGGVDVAGAHRGEVIAQRLPGPRLQLLGGHPGGHIDHRVAGVEGEGHESGGQAPVDALGGLDVVAVGAVAAVPALHDAAEGRVVDHRTGTYTQPLHIAAHTLVHTTPGPLTPHT